VLAIPVVSLLYGLTPTTVVLLAVMGALFDPAGYTARKALLTDTARAPAFDTVLKVVAALGLQLRALPAKG
jgi:hypothetical protein